MRSSKVNVSIDRLKGRIAHVTEVEHEAEGYTCLSVQPEYGTNEANLYVDRDDNRTTWELYVMEIRTASCSVLGSNESDESVTFTFVDKDGAHTYVHLECDLNTLLNAIEAERMALHAPTASRNLS